MAMAMAATVGGSGALDGYETVVLLEPSEVDEAMNVAVDYEPPARRRRTRGPAP